MRMLTQLVAVAAVVVVGAVLVAAGVRGPAPRTTFVVLRHAEAEDDGSRDPGLSEQGRERAARVGRLLASMDVARVLATDYQRTGQTATAIGERFGLEVERYEPGDEAGLVKTLRERFAGRVVVVVGHSNTVPGIMQALGVHVEPIGHAEHNRVYVVTPVECGGPVWWLLRS